MPHGSLFQQPASAILRGEGAEKARQGQRARRDGAPAGPPPPARELGKVADKSRRKTTLHDTALSGQHHRRRRDRGLSRRWVYCDWRGAHLSPAIAGSHEEMTVAGRHGDQ